MKYLFLLLSLGVFLFAVSCGDSGGDGADDCDVGAEGCACTVGGACDAGLVCESNRCVDQGIDSTDTGTDSESGGDTSTGTDTGEDTDTGTGTGEDTDECGDIEFAGTCDGNVFTWCDYYSGTVLTQDCDALGATCVAAPNQPTEDDNNGCHATCNDAVDADACAGRYERACHPDDKLVIRDCRRSGGPSSQCVEGSSGTYCERTVECDAPESWYCSHNAATVCDESGVLAFFHCDYIMAGGLTCGMETSTRACCMDADDQCQWYE